MQRLWSREIWLPRREADMRGAPNSLLQPTSPLAGRRGWSSGVRPMKATRFASRAASGLILVTALAQTAVHSEAATPVPLSPTSIDGTYELTERVMANGTVLRPPAIVSLCTMTDGRFSLNLFVKNADGTIASESSVGRYTFSADKYCEWIVYTIRNNLDKPGGDERGAGGD